MYPTNDFILFLPLVIQAEQSIPQIIGQVTDMAKNNPLIAVGALVAILFLTRFMPSRRSTRRARTYGGRPISYHLGSALGAILRGRSGRR